MSEVCMKCPWCDEPYRMGLDCPYDGEEYDECECKRCGGMFSFELEVHVQFSANGIEKIYDNTDEGFKDRS